MEKFIIVRCADSQTDNQVKLGQSHNLEENLKGVILPVEADEINTVLDKTRNDLEAKLETMLSFVRKIVKGKTEDIFLKWMEDLSESNYTAPVPNQFKKQKMFSDLVKVMKVLVNPSESLIGDLVKTSEGYVLTLTLDSNVIFQDLVEPMYRVIDEEVDLSSTQSEALDREEEEEVAVEPPPAQHQTFSEERPSFELVVCEHTTETDDDFLIGFDVDKVILANEALWQRYSISGTNALW